MPPPSTPPLIALPTLTLMIIITFLMQGSAIFFNSLMVKEYKGVILACFATVSLALGFASNMLRGILPNFAVGFLANLMTTTGHVLIYLSICRFLNFPPSRWLTRGLIPAGYALLLLASFVPGIPLIIATQVVAFPLDLSTAYLLYRSDVRRFKLGAALTAIPLAVYAIILFIRLIVGIVSPASFLPGPSFANIFDALSFYVLSYLWSAGFILMISQRLQSDLNDLAMNDALTRIRNRRAMQNMLAFEMKRVQSEVKDFSIVLIDVDHFKRVNDTHGHDVGDAVLQWVAQTLSMSLRENDHVARWGGEEFLLLLPDTTLEQAREIAERLRAKVEHTPVEPSPVPLRVTFSGGVANSKSNRNVDSLCKTADQALYIAKQKRNCIVTQDEIPA